MFPIMKYEKRDFKSDEEREHYAEEVYWRGSDYRYEESELDYFVRVALPYYPTIPTALRWPGCPCAVRELTNWRNRRPRWRVFSSKT